MGSIEARPNINDQTANNLLIGMPFVEFAPKLPSGAFGSFRQLGIIDSANITKTIETVALRSAQSGIDQLVRELVRSFEARLVVNVFEFSGDNMQLFFASSSRTQNSAGTTSVVDETVTLAASAPDWADLANALVQLTPTPVVTPSAIVDEAVGTGDGTSGDTSGDFSLDFKPLVVGDVTSVTVGVDSYTPVGVGAAVAGLEVEVVVGTGATSGDLQFFSGGVATNVTGAIVATYTPSHTLVENTDYVLDYSGGRIRRPDNSTTVALRNSQPVDVDYDYQTFESNVVEPYTQFVFEGRARVKLLTDVGINITWTIPLVNVRITDTDFAFNREEFASGELSFTLVDDGTTTPFGTLEVFEESAA